jgi:hypothetical protein
LIAPTLAGESEVRVEMIVERVKQCCVPECGRPTYARGLCQTPHRQLLKEGQIGVIRPYRTRSRGTVKFSGLRVTRECASEVKAYAKARRCSWGAAIAYILEDWGRTLARREIAGAVRYLDRVRRHA